jgi:hypothetical protein
VFTPEKSIFSILGQAFPVYGKNAKYLAVITLMAFVPVFAFVQFIPPAYVRAADDFIDMLFLNLAAYGQMPEMLNALPIAAINDAMSFFLIIFGIELAFFPISVAAATYLVFKHLKEEEPSFGGMFTAALPIMPKMIVTSAIAALIVYLLLSFTFGVFGGLLLILTLYIAVGMVFYQHIVADVGRWGFNAISLSRFIIRGRWFRVFFGIIVIFVSYSVLSSLMYSLWLALGIVSFTLPHLPFFLLQNFILSYFAIAFALWYFDIKRFHAINFQEIEKEIMEKMRQHMDRFGKDKGEEKKDEEDEK